MCSQLQCRGAEGGQGPQERASTDQTTISSPTPAQVQHHWCTRTFTGPFIWTIAAASSQVALNVGRSTEPVLIYLCSSAPRIKPNSNEGQSIKWSTATPPTHWNSLLVYFSSRDHPIPPLVETRTCHPPASVHPEAHGQLLCFWASGFLHFTFGNQFHFFKFYVKRD